jgi:hypothetical protein
LVNEHIYTLLLLFYCYYFNLYNFVLFFRVPHCVKREPGHPLERQGTTLYQGEGRAPQHPAITLSLKHRVGKKPNIEQVAKVVQKNA